MGMLHLAPRPDRFRCCICWRSVHWALGVCDAVDRRLTKNLTWKVWADRDHPEERISDGSICNDCWYGMGAVDEERFSIGVLTHAQALQNLPVAPGFETWPLGS